MTASGVQLGGGAGVGREMKGRGSVRDARGSDAEANARIGEVANEEVPSQAVRANNGSDGHKGADGA